MKLKHLSLLFIVIFLFSCKKDDQAPDTTSNNSATKTIMPLEASRVEGDRPTFESFRYELWKDLIENDLNFDFIGTKKDGATYASVNGNNFDVDHEGRGGWTSGQILTNISNWVSQAGIPDIVLFSSPGGNDALQNLSYPQAIININGIIDSLQSANPNITILIERMAPGNSAIMTPQLTTYFNQMQQDVLTIATNQTTSTSQVIAIDMFTGFTDAMLADPVHYNSSGADFIATRYYTELAKLLAKN